jgi:Fic family protein
VEYEELDSSPVGRLVPIQDTDARYGPYACFAFMPNPLPDDLQLSMETINEITRATGALARLDQACEQIKEPSLLIRPSLLREALDTSALEGTYGQLTDILEAELPGSHYQSRETREILGYFRAAQNAFMSANVRPISLGLLSEAQATMFEGAEHPPRQLGKVREHQVWIGSRDGPITEARFVPLPGDDRLKSSVEAWVEWVNAANDWPIVLRAALAHYQFETLHPFSDGNGRIGRLLIVLQLLRSGAISHPAITISPWLVKRRDAYQDHLFAVSRTGNWDPWIQFFCKAIIGQCGALIAGVRSLCDWLEAARVQINERRWTGGIYDVLTDLTQWPVTSIAAITQKHGVTATTAANIVSHLTSVGVLHEMTGKAYGRTFGAAAIMKIVEDI